jgi:hypothetical protein
MSRQEYLTPRDRLGPNQHVYGRVYRTDSGVYLLVAPHLGENDPVFTVGWARNDYWAVQIWGFNGSAYRNDRDPDAASSDPPSLETMGWPDPLGYAEALACAKRVSDGPVMVSAGYRFTDGGFMSHAIHAAPRVKFHFDQPNPKPGDPVVAVELGLGGERWERHLAEIQAINRQNSQRS